ncbi:membrane protein [Streptomyces noursei ATCC 11455]|nr:membrane protein [Streptomyces noursei ATCC 11455]
MQYRLGMNLGGSSDDIPNSQPVNSPNFSRKGGVTAWHPTTVYLVLLVLAEFGTYAVLRHVFRNAHGG